MHHRIPPANDLQIELFKNSINIVNSLNYNPQICLKWHSDSILYESRKLFDLLDSNGYKFSLSTGFFKDLRDDLIIFNPILISVYKNPEIPKTSIFDMYKNIYKNTTETNTIIDDIVDNMKNNVHDVNEVAERVSSK